MKSLVPSMESSVFSLQSLALSGGTERILKGGRNLFPLLMQAFEGIKQIGIIGWGSQAPAQAQNLRDTLKLIGSDIVVKVGLRRGSDSLEDARNAGFTQEDGTLGEMWKVVRTSDLLILLISDAGQTQEYQDIFSQMRKGATLGLSHGFLYGHLKSIAAEFRPDINVILMAPKGAGPTVRERYLLGAHAEGVGINSSVAVHQNVNGRAWEYALGWAVATGAPAISETTLEQEVISDLFGERAMLLAGFWGLVESLDQRFLFDGLSVERAFLNSAVGLVTTVTDLISEFGLLGAYKQLGTLQQDCFKSGYATAYSPAQKVMWNLYEEVSSWREISSVIRATEALDRKPMSDVESSLMWKDGMAHYGKKVPMNRQLAFSMGMYVGGIVAGLDTLEANGHRGSERVNEQLFEALYSLNPTMAKNGLASMVDNCSITARLGARKWGPVFQQAFTCSRMDPVLVADFDAFLDHPVHGDIEKCSMFKPAKIVAN